jgi:hypothetical protein
MGLDGSGIVKQDLVQKGERYYSRESSIDKVTGYVLD